MDRQTKTADWIVPAILAGVGLMLTVALAAVVFVSAGGGAEETGLASELEAYTRCLNDHGAEVPVVEARRDGGFSVTVSGALLADGPDPSAWWTAHGECSDVAPDVFGGLFDGLAGGVMGGFGGNTLLDGILGGILDSP